jgi:hypothetical protein
VRSRASSAWNSCSSGATRWRGSAAFSFCARSAGRRPTESAAPGSACPRSRAAGRTADPARRQCGQGGPAGAEPAASQTYRSARSVRRRQWTHGGVEWRSQLGGQVHLAQHRGRTRRPAAAQYVAPADAPTRSRMPCSQST